MKITIKDEMVAILSDYYCIEQSEVRGSMNSLICDDLGWDDLDLMVYLSGILNINITKSEMELHDTINNLINLIETKFGSIYFPVGV